MPLPAAISLILVAKYPFLKKRSMETDLMIAFMSAIRQIGSGKKRTETGKRCMGMNQKQKFTDRSLGNGIF
jgi:hypothetical protein